MEFALEDNQRCSVKHLAADGLSSRSTIGTDDKDNDDEIPVLTIQKQSPKEKNQLRCSCQQCDDKAVDFEPHSIMTARAVTATI